MSVNKKNPRRKKLNIEVTSSSIGVVSFNQSPSFFLHEIANEGSFRDNVPLIFLFPESCRGKATPEAIKKVFEYMKKVREH